MLKGGILKRKSSFNSSVNYLFVRIIALSNFKHVIARGSICTVRKVQMFLRSLRFSPAFFLLANNAARKEAHRSLRVLLATRVIGPARR